MNAIDKIVELYRSSVIVQSTLSLLLCATICVLYISGKEVPDSLLAAFFVVLGFYFRQKRDMEVENGRANIDN